MKKPLKLTQSNLDTYGALFTVLPDGRGLVVTASEMYEDIETELYEDLGGEWDIISNENYADPCETVEELLSACPELKNAQWQTFDNIKFH